MKFSTLTMAFVTIMIHILLLLTAYSLQEQRVLANVSTDAYTYPTEERIMRVLMSNTYK